jgi:hypothetical protein
VSLPSATTYSRRMLKTVYAARGGKVQRRSVIHPRVGGTAGRGWMASRSGGLRGPNKAAGRLASEVLRADARETPPKGGKPGVPEPAVSGAKIRHRAHELLSGSKIAAHVLAEVPLTGLIFPSMTTFLRFSVFALAGLAGSAHAAVIVTIQQVGSNVVATTTGSFLSFDGLAQVGTIIGIGSPRIAAQQAYLQMPATADGSTVYRSYDAYEGSGGQWISAPDNFGSGGLFYADQSAGNTGFVISRDGILIVDDYVLGTPIDTTATWFNSTLSGLGLLENVSKWTWTGDSLTLAIGNAVPEPSTYAMVLAGLACGGYLVRRQRKRA